MVPTFTTNRSTREMPSYIPAASPRVRRSLSSWPPHRSEHPGCGVARSVLTAGAHDTPTQIHQVRVGSTLTGLHTLVPLVHLLVSLAGPAPSGSADAPRRCQDCSPPSPASPGSGCPQLQPGCCDSPAARASHPYSVTLAPRGARTDHQTGDQNLWSPNGATWSASVVPSERPKQRWASPRRRYSPARLRPWQSLLVQHAAALPHVASSPGLGVLRRLRPVRGLQQATHLSPEGSGPRTVPMFTVVRSTGEAPGFAPAASSWLRRRPSPRPAGPSTSDRPDSSPPAPAARLQPQTSRYAPLSSPHPPGSSWPTMKRRDNTGSLRIPSRLAHQTRPIRQCWTVLTLSRLLPPSPAFPGSGCRQLHPTATTAKRRRSPTSIRNNSASWRTMCSSTPRVFTSLSP
jgi:hypothetical protein